jgi:hypothetical protein
MIYNVDESRAAFAQRAEMNPASPVSLLSETHLKGNTQFDVLRDQGKYQQIKIT